MTIVMRNVRRGQDVQDTDTKHIIVREKLNLSMR
jgi:hypothetical protein